MPIVLRSVGVLLICTIGTIIRHYSWCLKCKIGWGQYLYTHLVAPWTPQKAAEVMNGEGCTCPNPSEEHTLVFLDPFGCKKVTCSINMLKFIIHHKMLQCQKYRAQIYLLTMIRCASGPRDSVIWFRTKGRGCSLSIVSFGRKNILCQLQFSIPFMHALIKIP